MGRGRDSLARDQFSDIFGDRRGSSRADNWEERGEERIISARWREAGVGPRSGVVFVFPQRFSVEEGTEALAKVEKIFEVSEQRGECGALHSTDGRDMIYVLREELVGFSSLPAVVETLTLILGTGKAQVMVPERFDGEESTTPQRMLLRPVEGEG